MIFSRDEIKEKVPAIVLDIFRRYMPDAPEDCIGRIEKQSGVSLNSLDGSNAPAFLECMRKELENYTEGWKARFVTGVIARMIARVEAADRER